MMSFYLLIRMNSRILNGREIIIGGSIIMFIDISVVVIIRLIMRNGMKMMKLMMKVVCSFEIMNVGMSVYIGMLDGFLGLGWFVICVIRVRFFLCVKCSIYFCSGSWLMLMVCVNVRLLLMYGCMVIVLILVSIGYMMNSDRKSDSFVSIWFGGMVGSESVFFVMVSIMKIFVNDDIISSSVGVIDSRVIFNRVRIDLDGLLLVLLMLMVIFLF